MGVLCFVGAHTPSRAHAIQRDMYGMCGAASWSTSQLLATAVSPEQHFDFLRVTGTWIALEESHTAYEMKEVSLYGSGGEPGYNILL